MDPTNNYSVEKQLAELRASLKTVDSETGPLSDIHGSVSGYESAANDAYTVNLSGLQYNNTVIGGGYTISPPNTTPYYSTGSALGANWGAGTNPWVSNITTTHAGRMELNGDNADLIINGVSLMEILQDRLNIMVPNPELEKEWAELKRLGDRYRKLEKKLKEQGDMWAKLKAMPPPDLS